MREEQSRLNIHEKIKTRVSLVVPVEPFEGVLLVFFDLRLALFRSIRCENERIQIVRNRDRWVRTELEPWAPRAHGVAY